MNDRMSIEAIEYHTSRLEYHVAQGLTYQAAVDAADWDLLDWSQPLDLPAPRIEDWFE